MKEGVKKLRKSGGSILDKKTTGEKILYVVVFAIFTLQSLSLILPVGWMIMSSLKGLREYETANPFALPVAWEFENYLEAFKALNAGDTNFFGMILNSLWYTIISTALGVFVPATTGYIMSKYRFPGHGVIFSVAIIAMVIPIVGSAASRMKIIAFLHLDDSPLYAIVNSLGGFGGTFLVYYGFFKALSWSYAEAVMIDGGGHFTIFFKIMLPQAMPILLTYAITGAIGYWNEYETMILYLPSYPTLASGLFEFQSVQTRSPDWPVYFAGLIISVIPTIALFCAFSDRIMTSLSIGGLKG